MNLINRTYYLNRIDKYLGQERIIVLTGQRRVGKSSILKTFKTSKENIVSSNIIYIDKEDRTFDKIKTYTDLNTYIDSKISRNKHNYILIDEVQDIQEFERSLRSFIKEENTDIIITGSNSKLLSSELTTLIGGRYKEIYIQALTYLEFLQFHNLQDSDESLTHYINFGGLPGIIKIGLDEHDAYEYQTDVYSTVLLKDIISRNNIRNTAFLENLLKFLADNTGKIISATSISKYMKSQDTSVTSVLVLNYIRMLCESYLLHKINRYDIHGKRLFESNDKYYFEDIGIRNAIACGTRDEDIEKILENIVYNHLIHLGYEVTVGQLRAGEIDFVCTKSNEGTKYVQVAYIIANEDTRMREFGNLATIKDSHPKYVISMTPLVSRTDNNGIIHLNIRQFLKNGLE
ncbi:MAG: ATP-binding protein [Paludibacteraceae bacterium]|nr:ATP-binding protein [Paludibacteraceae bacterium]